MYDGVVQLVHIVRCICRFDNPRYGIVNHCLVALSHLRVGLIDDKNGFVELK